MVENASTVWGRGCWYGTPAGGANHREAVAACFGASSLACTGHGVCWFGECLCEPGYGGVYCERELSARTNRSRACLPLGPRTLRYRDYADACLLHPAYGAAVIPAARWRAAQAAEARLWATLPPQEAPGHADSVRYFDGFRSLSSLGRVAEVGSGMWTWTRDLLSVRPDLHAESVSLIDPGIPGYLASGKATFRDGHLRGVPVELLPMGAEQVPACYSHSFDVVVQIQGSTQCTHSHCVQCTVLADGAPARCVWCCRCRST
jgi:hypothetical protein